LAKANGHVHYGLADLYFKPCVNGDMSRAIEHVLNESITLDQCHQISEA